MPVETITIEHPPATVAPLYVQIRDAIATQINAGALSPGERLPPTREIAAMSGVALRTVTEGIRLLQEEGRVVAMPGRGVFVRPKDEHTAKATLYLFLHPDGLAPTTHSGMGILQGIMEAAGANEIDLHPLTTLDGLQPADLAGENVAFLFFDVHYRTDGFGWVADLARERGIPCCVAGRGRCEFPSLRDTRDKGFKQAVDHLAGLGHRRIALINASTDPALEILGTFSLNRRGYLRGLRSHGIRPVPDLYVEAPPPEDGGSEEATRAAVDRLLSLPNRPTAVVCNNDYRALLVLEILRERGVRVPEDISLVGFDDMKRTETSRPPLTTVDGKAYERGRVAVEYLLAKLAGRRVRDPEVVPRLVVRKSTAAPPDRG